MNENKSVFCIRYTTHRWKEKRKTHAQDIIREEVNTVHAKIVSYTKLKSTVGLEKTGNSKKPAGKDS